MILVMNCPFEKFLPLYVTMLFEHLIKVLSECYLVNEMTLYIYQFCYMVEVL